MQNGFDILLALLVCGLGLIGTGIGLAFCQSRAGKIKSLIGGIVFIFAVTGVFSRPLLTYELLTASGSLAIAAFIWFIRSPSATTLWHCISRPRIAGVITAVTGTTLVASTFHYDFDDHGKYEEQLALLEQSCGWHPPLEVAPVNCMTDAGTAVPVYMAAAQRPHAELVHDEKKILTSFEWENRIIHRSPADDESNCHGWVFTGGKYWVLSSDVMTIVTQNGYRPVRLPRPGDLAIYKREDGSVTHTGIVRSVGAVTMVESKWGWMGVYLHAVESSCYGSNYTFYHNPSRSGHQFAQLNPSDAAPIARSFRATMPARRPEPNR